jgi:hypothetical protein
MIALTMLWTLPRQISPKKTLLWLTRKLSAIATPITRGDHNHSLGLLENAAIVYEDKLSKDSEVEANHKVSCFSGLGKIFFSVSRFY